MGVWPDHTAASDTFVTLHDEPQANSDNSLSWLPVQPPCAIGHLLYFLKRPRITGAPVAHFFPEPTVRVTIANLRATLLKVVVLPDINSIHRPFPVSAPSRLDDLDFYSRHIHFIVLRNALRIQPSFASPSPASLCIPRIHLTLRTLRTCPEFQLYGAVQLFKPTPSQPLTPNEPAPVPTRHLHHTNSRLSLSRQGASTSSIHQRASKAHFPLSIAI